MSQILEGTAGTICRSRGKQYERFDWKVEKFFSLSEECDHYYESPLFDFEESECRLRLYAHGLGSQKNEVHLYIILTKPIAEKRFLYTLGFQNVKGNFEEWLRTYVTFDRAVEISSSAILKRSELLRRKSELVSSGCITFSVIVSTADMYSVLDHTDASVQTDCEYKGAKVFNDENEPSEKQGVEKVVEDIGRLLASGDNSDVTVQVGDVQFNAHKMILTARSPVLAAMFQHETAEKISNEISISDCEPDIFKEFLRYIYTGNVQELTAQNCFALYRVADKYLANDLKLQCLIYIQDTLCVETFCDTVELALMHREDELLQIANDFASKNIGLIIRSMEWQNFIRDHPTEANEILIKSIQLPCDLQK